MYRRLLRNLLRTAYSLCFCAAAGAANAQVYFLEITGTANPLACTTTSATWSDGLALNWVLPSVTGVGVESTAGSNVVEQAGAPLIFPTGTLALDGGTINFAAIALPYTFRRSFTPILPSAQASSYAFDCVLADGQPTATNFRIENAPRFSQPIAAVPTLAGWALVALAAILAASAIWNARRGTAR